MESTLSQLTTEKENSAQLVRSALSRVDAAERERDLVGPALAVSDVASLQIMSL